MATPPSAESPGEARCSRCGEAFVCGLQAGSDRCWCSELPPLAPVAGLACLCRACLEQALARSKHVAG